MNSIPENPNKIPDWLFDKANEIGLKLTHYEPGSDLMRATYKGKEVFVRLLDNQASVGVFRKFQVSSANENLVKIRNLGFRGNTSSSMIGDNIVIPFIEFTDIKNDKNESAVLIISEKAEGTNLFEKILTEQDVTPEMQSLAYTIHQIESSKLLVDSFLLNNFLRNKRSLDEWNKVFLNNAEQWLDQLKIFSTTNNNIYSNIIALAKKLLDNSKSFNINQVNFAGFHGRPKAGNISVANRQEAVLVLNQYVWEEAGKYIKFYQTASTLGQLIVWHNNTPNSTKNIQTFIETRYSLLDDADKKLFKQFFIPILSQRLLGDLTDNLFEKRQDPNSNEAIVVPREKGPLGLDLNIQNLEENIVYALKLIEELPNPEA